MNDTALESTPGLATDIPAIAAGDSSRPMAASFAPPPVTAYRSITLTEACRLANEIMRQAEEERQAIVEEEARLHEDMEFDE